MSAITQGIDVQAKRLLRFQGIVTLVMGAGFFVVQGQMAGLSALYGALVSLLLVLLLSRGVRKAAMVAQDNPRQSMLILYVGAALRFILVLALFAIGLGLLKLQPLAAFAGFGVAQITNAVAARAKR